MGVSEKLKLLVPYAAMVTVESLDVGLTTLSKAAMERGMSHFVFVFYSNVLATLLLFPLSLFLNRGKRQPITFSLLCKFFLLGLFGITLMQNCVFTGINFSSPTLGSAMAQLVPAFTFVLAVIFRMERLNLRSSKSQIKIVSTAITIAGALIVVLYKGPPIGGHIIKLHSEPADSFVYTENSWILGGLFLAAACLSLSIFFTFQAVVLKEFPSELTAVFFYFLFGSIQSFVLSLIAERDWNVWKLRPDIELVSIFYSAICGNLVTFLILAWCVHKKGPVFVAMFKPLSIAIAAFLGVIFLNDTLHVGSIGGAVVIVAGFYGVVWSQSKEEGEAIVNNTDTPSSSSSQKTPLLDNHLNV